MGLSALDTLTHSLRVSPAKEGAMHPFDGWKKKPPKDGHSHSTANQFALRNVTSSRCLVAHECDVIAGLFAEMGHLSQLGVHPWESRDIKYGGCTPWTTQ